MHTGCANRSPSEPPRAASSYSPAYESRGRSSSTPRRIATHFAIVAPMRAQAFVSIRQLGGSWETIRFELGSQRKTSLSERKEAGKPAMRTTPVPSRSHVAWRLIGKVAVVGLVTSPGLLFAAPGAGASGGLSSIILAEPEPGLVAAAPGPYNGPLTQSNLGLVLGSAADGTNALGQSLASGDVTAYVRTWSRQPKNGDVVLILAFQFKSAPFESSFIDGLDGAIQRQAGATPLAVPGIPGAAGAAVQTSSSGTPLSEYVVAFAKGNTAFEIDIASSSGDLFGADAIAMANSQFAIAPDSPAGTPGTQWNWSGTAILGGGLLATIAMFVIGRRRKYPIALRGVPPRSGPYRGLPLVGLPAPPTPPWSPAGTIPTDARTKMSTDQWP